MLLRIEQLTKHHDEKKMLLETNLANPKLQYFTICRELRDCSKM